MSGQQKAYSEYLETEVMTAPPQKLQLLLIEGAIRFIERTKEYWQQERYDLGIETLIRAQDIISEILGGLRHDVAPELVRKVAAVYVFVFRHLVDASMDRDIKKLDEALRVLNEERETWRLVCEKLGGTIPKNHGQDSPPPTPHVQLDGEESSLSMEA